MLGGALTVPTLDGDREVEIPAGAQPGESIRLRGLGLPSLRERGRGDQYVLVDVTVPGKLSREQRELVERLDAELAEAGDKRSLFHWRRRG
jgi:molecular chaperone DnaJ